MTPSFGLAFETTRFIMPPELALAYRHLGAGHVRILFSLSTLAPAPNVRNWPFLEETIRNIQAAGMEAIPNWYFYPSWITGGLDAMSSYDTACTKGAIPLPEDQAPSFCYDVVPVDRDAMESLGEEIGEHCAAIGGIEKFGNGNEYGVRDYFCTSRDDTPQSAIERCYNDSILPFAAGMRRKMSNVKMIAQFDEFCDSGHCLEIDREARVLPIAGIHPYADVLVGERVTRGIANSYLHGPPHPSYRLIVHRERLALRSMKRSYYRDTIKLRYDLDPLTHATSVIAGRRVTHDTDPVTGEIKRTYDIDATTDNVIAMCGTFRERFGVSLDDRETAITEIQHADPIRLMHETGMDVTEHNPARYIDVIQEWYHNDEGKLDLRLASRGGKWELTGEGEELRERLSIPPHRRPTRH